ncbi:MAG: PadR family transcriptional regulator [Acidobacteriota bacterium]
MADTTIDRNVVRGAATTLILTLLAEEPMHGYQLAQAIRARSEGIFAFSEGTIYPLLYGLEDRGLVRGAWSAGDGGRRRKVYQLTPRGKRALDSRRRAWSLFSQGMRLVLGRGAAGAAGTGKA